MNNHQIKINHSCYCPSTTKKSIPDIIHGRITGYVHIYILNVRMTNSIFIQ
jgi:hypothetical protein